MKKKSMLFLVLILVLLCTGCFNNKKDDAAANQDMLTFLAKLESMQEIDRNNYIQMYYNNIFQKTTFPIISDKKATFVYKGTLPDVGIIGDAVGSWEYYIPLKNITGTDIYYKSIVYEQDAKLEYKFYSPKIGKIFLDGLNKNVVNNEFANNELIMSAYKYPEEIKENSAIPHGTIKNDTIICDYYDNYGVLNTNADRTFSVYLPPGYSNNAAGKKYKVIYFQDGKNYLSEAKVPNILDSMIAKKEIEPVVAVFINYINGNRDADYISKTKWSYADFFATTFLNKIESEYFVRNDIDGRIIVGESNSGSFSVYLAHKYPEKFKNVFTHSGAFNAGFNDYWEEIQAGTFPVRLYMISGLYEAWTTYNKAFYDTVNKNSGVIAVKYKRYNMSHCFGLWRDTIREGLMWLNDTNSKTSIMKNPNDKIISLNISWEKNPNGALFNNVKYYVTLEKSVETDMLKALKRQSETGVYTPTDYYQEVIPEKTDHINIPVKVDAPSCYKLFMFCDVDGNGKYNSDRDFKMSSNQWYLSRIILDAEDTIQTEFVTGTY